MIKFLVFSVIFETTTEALWQGRFFDLPVIIFVKKDRITLSVPIILSINQWSFYKLKMYRFDNQIYISQLITSFFSYKLLFEIKKIDMRLSKTLNLKFMLMFYDSVYPTRPFDTVTKYTIYSLSHWWKDYSNSLLYLLLLCLMASKTWLKNALHFTFWDFAFHFHSNLLYSNLLRQRFKQLLFGSGHSKNPKKLKTYVFGRLFFEM